MRRKRRRWKRDQIRGESDAIFYNEMEEQALEPTLNLLREKAKASRDAALQTSLLKSGDEAWTDAIDSRFSFETLRLFDYSFREHGEAVTDSTKKKRSGGTEKEPYE